MITATPFAIVMLITGSLVWGFIALALAVAVIFGVIPQMFRWISYASWSAYMDLKERRDAGRAALEQG